MKKYIQEQIKINENIIKIKKNVTKNNNLIFNSTNDVKNKILTELYYMNEKVKIIFKEIGLEKLKLKYANNTPTKEGKLLEINKMIRENNFEPIMLPSNISVLNNIKIRTTHNYTSRINSVSSPIPQSS